MAFNPRVPVILGAAFFGEGVGSRIHTEQEAQAFIDVLPEGGLVAIDTSRHYGQGTSEEMLGRLNLRGSQVDTKIYPEKPGDHKLERLHSLFQRSLEALHGVSIRIFYLHAPDRSVPFKETLRAVDELYRKGHFKEFGLSNFWAWEVAEVVGICEANGWIKPTVYQGCYNAIDRAVETELLPCLKKFGIRFFAYSPLASGFLAGTQIVGQQAQAGVSGTALITNCHMENTCRTNICTAVPLSSKFTKLLCASHDLRLSELAFRWIQHHSALGPENAIVIGGSRPQHIKQALLDWSSSLFCSTQGPLPDTVVRVIESAWAELKGNVGIYAI
ncbi:Aldo keto reductase [Sistotremastrum niveocremeum HHB9708]|uniref:Aldo keto reductase n=1 Tax=Sistotremastrum niveocremeum HHB9708 TaxID=1314777 RepID=A0A164YL87_9AGAM|nr:Aldo keto reductase [Sistotremastrum niveocremeum HHB9708]